MASTDSECKWVRDIPGQLEPVLVDGFTVKRVVCSHFVLTHFHADHTVGLVKSFSRGVIYCSEITKRLVMSELGIDEKRLVALQLGERKAIPELGIKMTFVDANHCPGAVVVLFESIEPHTAYLGVHTGDFRASADLVSRLKALVDATRAARVHTLWLDTTYALPPEKWRLPSMANTLQAVKRVCREELARDPQTVFVVGMYTIGKERVLQAVVDATGIKATPCNARRHKLLSMCGYGASLAPKGAQTQVIAAPLQDLTPSGLTDAYKGSSIVGFKCTGWGLRKVDTPPPLTAQKQYRDKWMLPTPACHRAGNAAVYTIPYSEHSSYDELCLFTSTVKPYLIVSTVGDAQTRHSAVEAVKHTKPTQLSIHQFFSSPPKRQKSAHVPEVIDVDSQGHEVIDLT